MTASTFTVESPDLSGVGTSIMGTFNGNLPVILGIAGVLIGVGLVMRWIKKSAK